MASFQRGPCSLSCLWSWSRFQSVHSWIQFPSTWDQFGTSSVHGTQLRQTQYRFCIFCIISLITNITSVISKAVLIFNFYVSLPFPRISLFLVGGKVLTASICHCLLPPCSKQWQCVLLCGSVHTKLFLAFLLATLVLHQFSESRFWRSSPPQEIKQRNRASARAAAGAEVKCLGPWRSEPSLQWQGIAVGCSPYHRTSSSRSAWWRKDSQKNGILWKKTHKDINKQKPYCFRPCFSFSWDSHWLQTARCPLLSDKVADSEPQQPNPLFLYPVHGDVALWNECFPYRSAHHCKMLWQKCSRNTKFSVSHNIVSHSIQIWKVSMVDEEIRKQHLGGFFSLRKPFDTQ